MIRDKYIASVYNMHREQCKSRREEEEPEVENTSYGYKKYMLNVHPTDGLALDFVRPSMHKKQIWMSLDFFLSKHLQQRGKYMSSFINIISVQKF